MKGKRIYLLEEEYSWRSDMPSFCVLGAFTTKEKAMEELENNKKLFLSDEAETLNKIPIEDLKIKERDDFYSILDENMGDYYELAVFEKTLK